MNEQWLYLREAYITYRYIIQSCAGDNYCGCAGRNAILVDDLVVERRQRWPRLTGRLGGLARARTLHGVSRRCWVTARCGVRSPATTGSTGAPRMASPACGTAVGGGWLHDS